MSECGPHIGREIIKALNDNYFRIYRKWGPKRVTDDFNFSPHYMPEGKSLSDMVKDELRRRIKLGFKGRHTASGQTGTKFSGGMAFSPAECPENAKLREDGCALPDVINVHLGAFSNKKVVEDKKDHRLPVIKTQDWLESIFKMPEEEWDAYRPNIKEIKVGFTMQGADSAKEFIDNFGVPSDFGLQSERNHEHFSSWIRIESKLRSMAFDQQTATNYKARIERRASYAFKHKKGEKKLSKMRHEKKRNESSLNAMKDVIKALNCRWNDIGKSVVTINTPSLEAFSNALTHCTVSNSDMNDQFQKLAELSHYVVYESKSKDKGTKVECRNGKLKVLCCYKNTGKDDEWKSIQDFFKSIVKVGIDEIHWTIDPPRVAALSSLDQIFWLHPLLVNGNSNK